MIDPSVIRCDGPNCQSVKRQTNHWFVVNTEKTFSKIFYALRFEDAEAAELAKGEHACSESCAVRLFSQWLSGQHDGSKPPVGLGPAPAMVSGQSVEGKK